MIENEIHLPEVIRVEDLGKAIDDVDCDVYDSDEWGVSKGELYRILEELPKYSVTDLIKLIKVG